MMSNKQDRLKDGTNKFMPGKVAALVKWNNKPLLDKMIDDNTSTVDVLPCVAWWSVCETVIKIVRLFDTSPTV